MKDLDSPHQKALQLSMDFFSKLLGVEITADAAILLSVRTLLMCVMWSDEPTVRRMAEISIDRLLKDHENTLENEAIRKVVHDEQTALQQRAAIAIEIAKIELSAKPQAGKN